MRQQESGLEQYKAEIQEELAGLAEHMHVAAAERAREDAEHRNRTEESARTLRTREETIGRLENEVQMREESIGRLENGVRTWEDMIRRLESDVRTREEMLGRLEGEVRTLRTQDETIGRLENGNRKRDEAIGRLENEVRELKQQLWNERELSESVRQQLRASEKSEVPPGRGGEESKKRGEAAERSARPSQLRKEARQPGAKAAAGSGDCPNCGEAGPDMMRKMRAENDELWGEKRRLEAQVKAREEEAERAMAALRREEAGVERLNGKVLALIDEKETFAQGRNEDERKRFDQMQGGESLVQRLKVVLKEQEAKVAELEGNVKKLLYEKDALELELARSAAGMEAIEKQRDFLLRAKEKQVVMLTQKVERLELAAGGKSEAGWDANQKEKLIAEVQDILEQYSMAGEGSVRWEKSTEREVEGAGEEMFESEGTVAASDGSERSLERSEEQTDGPLRVNGRSRYDGPEASGKDQASEQRRGLGETENERRSEESGLKADTTERAQFGREERVRTGVQAAPSEIERQMAGVQRTSEEEIATLREKVRLLEGRQGPLREERRVSVEHGTRTGATVGESAGGMAGAWKVGLVGHAAGITDPAADQSARLSPGERQNSDLGQPKVWSDKRPTGEEGTPSKQGLLGAIPATQAAERASDGEAKLFEDNASLRLKVRASG